jgi:tryptophan halogenase
MNGQIVKRVVIAGGGTAGWVVAAALGRLLGPLLDIVLVESDEIGTVGVGESTIPTARTFHHLLAVDERDFMRDTQSSFKLGIAFENWGRIGDRYIHSFGQTGKSTWMGDFQHLWLQARAAGFAGDIGDYCFELQAAEAGRFATSENAAINYAYHLDASAYARFLRRFSEKLGVKRVEGRIAEVAQHPETGFIEALVLASGQRIEGDLFIDCTGFRGLLIEQALGAGYEDWSQWLPTDSGLAVQTRSVGPAIPYTRAIAHDAGWQWRIPLQHRVGNGLVYCSAHLSDEDARARLLAQVEGEVLTEPRLIRYRTGRRRKAWDKNCVAFGLSSGFVEPLESTSIHMIMIGATRLVQLFPFGGFSEALIDRYNELARRELEGIRDFIILHYKLTERDDSPFWRRCREMEVPESLAQRIALFRDSGLAYQDAHDLFRIDSWVQVMLGQRLEPSAHHLMGRLMQPEQLRRALDDLSANIAEAVARMPTHQAFLEAYCGAAA